MSTTVHSRYHICDETLGELFAWSPRKEDALEVAQRYSGRYPEHKVEVYDSMAKSGSANLWDVHCDRGATQIGVNG